MSVGKTNKATTNTRVTDVGLVSREAHWTEFQDEFHIFDDFFLFFFSTVQTVL